LAAVAAVLVIGQAAEAMVAAEAQVAEVVKEQLLHLVVLVLLAKEMLVAVQE
jgi:hypothetical protein